jgi:vacuolar-type H+-ATPase subunit E/Vma4
MRAEAQENAQAVRQDAQQTALETVRQEEKRLRQEAELEMRHIGRAAVLEIVEQAVARARHRLDDLRHHPAYKEMLGRLTQEAYGELQKSFREGEQGLIVVDPSDESIATAVRRELGFDFAIQTEDDGLRGVMARSADQRVIVDNRLDSRLEQALPEIRRFYIAQMLAGDAG